MASDRGCLPIVRKLLLAGANPDLTGEEMSDCAQSIFKSAILMVDLVHSIDKLTGENVLQIEKQE